MNCILFPVFFRTAICGALLSVFALVNAGNAQSDHGQELDRFLSNGKLADSEKHFSQVCKKATKDHQARLALGLTQFLQALEGLGQANYRYGLISKHAEQIPLARLPVPLNRNPGQISYEKLRTVVSDFHGRIQQAEATLAALDTANVRLDFYIGRARLDLDGNGVLAEEETLWQVFAAINTGVEADQGTGFFIGVDGADVHWLRGYCHVLMAMCDVVLAHDEKELFERCGHLLFVDVDSPYQLSKEAAGNIEDPGMPMIFDAVATIHLINFRMIDQGRMTSAQAHLLEMISQSRLSWQRAMAETDNDHEWMPNPDQDSVMQMRVPREMITGWSAVLDELEAILQGKKLIPYWREYYRNLFGPVDIPKNGKGLNLRKVFQEARDFDLVLTIQGTNAEPFIEEGPLSTPESWDQLTRVFRGQFFGFAIWFN